ncbi:PIR Superfamily Protein [Plasmodium ovale wallikeri]|uniref:PIR Superfamily Protein n=1 Tax=Plasmodium ovale wallikeri TaxID=864142 RepID=A0A1A9ATP4_PLAOA|nr:PIR Superfamily Protein [Plasmodium ovale wallikeri]
MGLSDSEDDYSDSGYEEKPYDTIIKELPLNKFYAALDNDNHTNYTPKLCSGLQQSSSEDKDSFFDLCKKLEFKLNNFLNIKEQCNGIPDEQVCEYFNYWLGNEINEIDPNSNNVSAIEFACNLSYTALAKQECSYSAGKFKNKDFLNMKNFFHYTENLEAIYKIPHEFTILNDTFYCDYINDSVKKYNDIIKNGSCQNINCTYYNELIRFKEKFIAYYVSLNKKCSGTIKCIRKSKEEFESLCAPLPGSSAQHNQTYSQLPETPGDNSMSIPNVIIAVVCTILLIGFFFLFLYKFSPFGSWLRPKIGRKKRILDDIEDNEDEYLNNSVDININSNNNRYNITYHSNFLKS